MRIKSVKNMSKVYNWRTDYDWTDPNDHPVSDKDYNKTNYVPNLTGGTKPLKNWKLEESKKFTIAPAYNKGAYQVINKKDIKDIGK